MPWGGQRAAESSGLHGGSWAGRGASISVCRLATRRGWRATGLHRQPREVSDPCCDQSGPVIGEGCDASGAVGLGKDKSSWSDVKEWLKGTFLGSFHGYPVSRSSLPFPAFPSHLPPAPAIIAAVLLGERHSREGCPQAGGKRR